MHEVPQVASLAAVGFAGAEVARNKLVAAMCGVSGRKCCAGYQRAQRDGVAYSVDPAKRPEAA